MVGESNFKKYVWISLICFLVVSVFFGYQITNLKFDYDFEKFFPIDDGETDFFFDYRDKFESDNDFLLIAIENDAGAFEKGFLEDVEQCLVDCAAAVRRDPTYVKAGYRAVQALQLKVGDGLVWCCVVLCVFGGQGGGGVGGVGCRYCVVACLEKSEEQRQATRDERRKMRHVGAR